jgi:signal transduction histidine kinase/CHASE1-domain containing sensor protein/ActR/RegA family two-component response regulator
VRPVDPASALAPLSARGESGLDGVVPSLPWVKDADTLESALPMNTDPRTPAPRAPRSWIPLFVLGVSLALTFAATYYVAVTAQARDRLRFQASVQRTQASIENRMDTYIVLIRATSGLFASDNTVSREQFRTFLSSVELRRRYPGIQGIGFAQRVRGEERERFVEAVRAEGTGFRIWPESAGPEHFPILYLEPLDRPNLQALGFDMLTEPVRRAAMERARDTGLPAASGKVTLVQETVERKKQAGFLIYIPVYRRGAPLATLADRREALEGFVYAPFRAEDLLAGTFGAGMSPAVAFQVFAGQGTNPESLLYRSEPEKDRSGRPSFTTTRSFDLAGQPWTISYQTLPSFDEASGKNQAAVLLIIGLFTSGVLLTVTQAQVRAREVAERAAAGLRDEAEITETLRSIGTAMAAELDLEKLLQTITDAATRITGAQFGSFFYNQIDEQGESYMLYTLSGVSREAFAGFPMPRNTALFGPTFRGEGIVRIDDVPQDPRHGKNPPYHGMPKGHLPVRSYLAAPVKSRSGEVLGGLFFGHGEPGVFTPRAERILAGIAAQAAIAIDNARLYEAERRLRAEAETANQAKDHFMATLSHELRTPLTPVLAVLSAMEPDERVPESVRDTLAVVRRNVELEARLIDDLLDLTRVTQGKLELRPRTTDLRQVIEHALEASAAKVPESNRPRIVTEIAPGDHRLWADAPRLTQVLWNLLSNALKFTPAAGEVRVRTRREEGWLTVEVSDTGIGIDPERLPRIFDAFEQGERSITRKFGGLGLGLAISQRIVELHGGTLTAASEGQGKGSTFTARLPVGDLQDQTMVLLKPPLQAPAGSADQPLHILLVEDHPDTADAMATLLRTTGRQVTVANSVREALEAAQAADTAGGNGHPKIDLVISDLGLPDGTGLELMSELSSRYGLKGIALSGYGMDEDIQKSQEAGFSRHLTKPVTLQTLESAIAQVAGGA